MTHQDFFELTPAYVNGALSDVEKAEMERAARGNPALAAEIEACRKIAAAVKSDPSRDEAYNEFGWRRLQRDLSRPERAYSDASSVSPLWRYAAALLGVVAIGQATALVFTGSSDQRAQYVTAGETTAATFTAKAAFKSDAQIGEIDTLLKEVRGEFIGGPSSRGLYRLRFNTEIERDEALTLLKTRSDIVVIAAVE